MIKVKSSQKVFTDTETATLTGICLEHLHNLARTRHIGFIVRAAAAAGKQAGPWLFTPSPPLGPSPPYRPRPPSSIAGAFCLPLAAAGCSPDFGGSLGFVR